MQYKAKKDFKKDAAQHHSESWCRARMPTNLLTLRSISVDGD
jgi:hypothetical protein